MINPATEKSIATISLGSADDINLAVEAARKAFESYSATSKTDRLGLLQDILTIYKKRYDEMAEVISLELGAPISMSHKSQAACGVGHLEGFLEAFEKLKLRQQLDNGDILIREPIGVCGLITPWNWPVNQIALKVLPALAVGCTSVLKPSEMTPLSAILYAEILHEAGVPRGVFNLVNGEGPVAGAALSRHPDVNMMSFTGSTRAGVAVTRDAAETVKKVTLELGGKSPNILFADADVEKAVKRGVFGVFYNSGQSCNAPTRMLVERSIYKKVLEIAKKTGESQLVGDPAEPGRHIGPVVSELQFDRIQALIKSGIEEGANLLVGGPGKPTGFDNGFYVKPTIFCDVSNDMRIAREEIFGPVLSIIPFEDEDEAISIANDTPYGLAAYVETGDDEKAERVAGKLRAGQVYINGTECEYGSPFGGYKTSGLGREGGLFGLEDFLEMKAVSRP
uniref:aldehyde dehydrogenase (NAD(+)) n=1 Tax=uncultured bacterium ws085G8 TaxID=1131825 RepID=I1X5B9_9BACT|nr:aldehyde dehydrogenase family protein [uncultured bacterium ws085G8]